MTPPALVLVHGGAHAADCWDLVVDEIDRLAPDLTVLAVDLPGRRGKPTDLTKVTIADWVDSVVADIDAAGLGDVVIVGHSLAGITVPGVVTKLGGGRVRELILAAAFVPPEGCAVLDTLTGPLAGYARRKATKGGTRDMPRWIAALAFYNGVRGARRRVALGRLCTDSTRVIAEPVSRVDMPAEVPRTWIMTQRDRALSTKSQLASIDALGGVQTVIRLDTCHSLMVSEPERLAELLVARCRLYAVA
jgi:pimeloyl-ACP methyl ester carboxylesterase